MKHPILAGALAATIIIATAFLMGSAAIAAECGKASWYGGSHHGRLTASGEVFNQYAMTAAMPSRKYLGRVYKVTSGGKSVTVTITDTGGFARYGRLIDLSQGAFAKLANTNRGVIQVCLTRVR